MSSDEEIVDPDPVDKIRRFRVFRKCWLSPQVTALHAQVDAKSLQLARETFVRGSIPHRRIREEVPPLSQNGAVVIGLPKNAYLGAYLARLDGFDRQMLRMRETHHPF